MLARLARCARGKSKNGNPCRNLHRMLTNECWRLPVQISEVLLWIRNSRTRREQEVLWPIIHLSDWARYELAQGGHFLLAGCTLSDEASWQSQLQEFWNRYRGVDPSHPIFNYPERLAHIVPFMTHGDEGRGRLKQPLLTISFQGILSHYGAHRLNTSGCSDSLLY